MPDQQAYYKYWDKAQKEGAQGVFKGVFKGVNIHYSEVRVWKRRIPVANIELNKQLFGDVQRLIDEAKNRAAVAVNSELTRLYWQIGCRIKSDVLLNERAEYGKQVIAGLSQQLTDTYGKGWSQKQLHHCLRFAESFLEEEIVYTLCRQLSWSHLRALIYIDNTLKRDFYLEMARLERWSVRQLQERISSQLFERTTISRKPEETVQHDIEQLRQEQQLSPSLLLKDPYILDFLNLNDRYIERDVEDAIAALQPQAQTPGGHRTENR